MQFFLYNVVNSGFSESDNDSGCDSESTGSE